MLTPVSITCYTDILCVWAYIAERRLAEIRNVFGDKVSIDHRFIPLFGDTGTKFADGWKDRGGFEGYAEHVSQVAAGFDHVSPHPDIWRNIRPTSSTGIHLMLKAIGLVNDDPLAVEKAATHFRTAFFEEGRDISNFDVQMDVLKSHGINWDDLAPVCRSGEAFAALHQDGVAQAEYKIEGSPTYLLNNGRQKLFGNVGFKIIEANIQELLRDPRPDQATWC